MTTALESTKLLKFLEARVGIEPTSKGFADLYSTSPNHHTVDKIANFWRVFAGFLPGGAA